MTKEQKIRLELTSMFASAALSKIPFTESIDHEEIASDAINLTNIILQQLGITIDETVSA